MTYNVPSPVVRIQVWGAAYVYYKHSGRFSIGGLTIGALVGCSAASILGYLYARGSVLIDDERFAVLATVAFGAAIGACTGYGLIWGKVRNQRANVVIQAAASLLGLYLSWAVWVDVIFQRDHVENPGWAEFAKNPGILWRAVSYINQYGTWSLGKGDATKGFELWLVWGAEAAMVIGISMFVGYEVLRRHAFCERCESWCRRGAKLLLSSPHNVTLLKRQLESNDWKSLETLTAGNKGADHLAIMLDSCEQCGQLHTMSMTHTAVFRNKLRQTKVRNTNVIQHLLIGPAQAETLRQLSTKITQAGRIAAPQANAAASSRR